LLCRKLLFVAFRYIFAHPNIPQMNIRIIGTCLTIAALVATTGCKKKKKDDEVKTPVDIETEGLTRLRTENSADDGTLKWLSVKRFSVSTDGNLNVFYERSNAFGPPELFRRTYSATGDTLGVPAIAESIKTIAKENDVNDNWYFVPNSGKLTLSYHKPSTYTWGLYDVETGIVMKTILDASFGILQRPAYDGTFIGGGGYEAYYSNSTTFMSDAYFHYNYGPVGHKFWHDVHVISDRPEDEDNQRRVFSAEPADANHIAMCYMDGKSIHVNYYDINTEATEGVDSMSTNILQHLSRRIVADAWITTRTTTDGQKIVYMIRYVKPGGGSDAWLYSSFVFDKNTRKLKAVVNGHQVSSVPTVNVDDNGYLLYSLADDQAPTTNTVYKVMADGVANKIAVVKGTTNVGATIVNSVEQHQGKIYVLAASQSHASLPIGPRCYIMVVK